MVFSVSPSVIVREVDLTTTIPSISTPPAAVAGVFRWGPMNERVLISSEIELSNVFGKPTEDNYETFFTAADFLSYSNALYVTRVDNDANTASGNGSANNTLFEAKYPGSIGNDISVTYVATSDEGDTTAFETNLFNANTTTYSIGFRDNVLEVTTDLDLIDIDVKIGDVLRIETDTSFQDMVVTSIANIDEANSGLEFTHAFTFAQRYTLPTDAVNVTRRWAYSGTVNGAPEAGKMHILVIDRTGTISGTAGQLLEKFENLSPRVGAQTSDGTNIYYRTFLEDRSFYLNPGDDDIGDSVTGNITEIREYISLEGGSDGVNERNVSIGVLASGYDLYKEANDVDISFVLQGKAAAGSNLANYLVSNISEYRKDCMTFISPSSTDVVNVSSEQNKLNNVLAFRSALQNSSYWFMDSGYKYRYDKYNDVYRWTPLNGDMAGIASRVEPWESPAGVRKGRVRNVIKLAFNPNKAQRDILYGKDINPVISQVGQGTILFGDKTGLGTATGSAFTRVNVRRLFITLEKAIATISAQFLFEFNDEFTQNQFRQVVEPFLRDIQGRRGIIDYRVVSDATINTPDIVDQNTFRANLFIKPARSINFIELTFIATRTGVSFEELVGQQF